jgi:ADP-ribose diphosphatase
MSKKRDVPKVLNVETIARTRLFHVERVKLAFTNGAEVEYERVPGSQIDSVLIVPLLNLDTVLLIREYAAGTHRYELGFPKGVMEQGEDAITAANREIMEEIGYAARTLRHLTSVTIAPGYIGHVTHIILAENLYEERMAGDEPEEIEVVPWPLVDIDGLLARDDFTEARSIAALFLARKMLSQYPLCHDY